jgi:hypothetical protein
VHVDEINPDVLIFKIKQQSKSLKSAFKKKELLVLYNSFGVI